MMMLMVTIMMVTMTMMMMMMMVMVMMMMISVLLHALSIKRRLIHAYPVAGVFYTSYSEVVFCL